jgi:hypothetical protein
VDIRYHIDAETGLPHIYDHGVSEVEVREILSGRCWVLRGRRRSKLAMGQTRSGRYLKVIFAPDEDGEGVFVITAYPLTGRGLAAFRRRRRQ